MFIFSKSDFCGKISRMINYYFKSVKDQDIKKLDAPKPGAWIFAYDVNHKEFKELVNLGFDEDYLEDALDFFEVPRVEYEDGINYFFTRYVMHSKDNIATAPVLIAISDSYILTVSHAKPEFLDDFAHGRKKAITTQRIKFFLLILDTVVTQYERSLMQVRKSLAKFLNKVESVTDDDLKEIVKIESRLNEYISALLPTAAALKDMLTRKKTLTLHEEDVDILEDLMLDIEQIIDNAKAVYKTAQNIRATHEVILGHQLNATMKTLTALTILFAIPTIMTGMFGMNVWLPVPEGPVAFLIVVLATAALSFYASRIFSKKGWL